jgi:aerobic-type carbon monoxide dehydrogenase small subunit (CoxS/CutS family)
MSDTISFRLNGEPVQIKAESGRRLLWALRTDLGKTGAKYGCGHGYCGACTVLVGGRSVRSCLLPVEEVQGKDVLTIEGLEREGRLHPIQQAFLEHDALQCGFCTSGMILQAYALLAANPAPSEADIVTAMDPNLCRCGAHVRIIRAIQAAATAMRKAG